MLDAVKAWTLLQDTRDLLVLLDLEIVTGELVMNFHAY